MTSKNQQAKDTIKDALFSYFNVSTLDGVRDKVKKAAKYEYGCKSSRFDVGKGIEVSYTDNSNCFASVLVHLRGCGMVGSYALSYSDLTMAGRMRGCDNHNHFIFD